MTVGRVWNGRSTSAESGLALRAFHLHPTTRHPIAASLNRSIRPAIFVWIWIVLAQAQFRKRSLTELTQGGGFDSQVLFQVVVWVFLGFLAIFLVSRGRVNWDLICRGPLKWYLGFVLIALASSLYSPAPGLSAFRAMQHLIALILVASLGRHLKQPYMFATVFLGMTAVLVILGAIGANFGLSWITPPSGSSEWSAEPEWRFGSAFGHPTQLATLAAVAVLTAIDTPLLRARAARVTVIVFNMVCIILAASRTASAGLVVGFVIASAAKRRLIPLICFAGVLLSLVALVPDLHDTAFSYFNRSQSSQDLGSLNGRVALYEDAWRRIQEHWFLGQGFVANRVLILDEQSDGSGAVHSHNLLLEALTGTGVFGAFFALAACVHVCVLPIAIWFRSRGNPTLRLEAMLLASALPPVLGGCILDAGFATAVSPIAFAFIALAARGQAAMMACSVSPGESSRLELDSGSKVNIP
jgi:O-antigen ligase